MYVRLCPTEGFKIEKDLKILDHIEEEDGIGDEEPIGDKYFEFRVLEKLFISDFNVVSGKRR